MWSRGVTVMIQYHWQRCRIGCESDNFESHVGWFAQAWSLPVRRPVLALQVPRSRVVGFCQCSSGPSALCQCCLQSWNSVSSSPYPLRSKVASCAAGHCTQVGIPRGTFGMVQNGDTRGGADAWWLAVVDAAENAHNLKMRPPVGLESSAGLVQDMH